MIAGKGGARERRQPVAPGRVAIAMRRRERKAEHGARLRWIGEVERRHVERDEVGEQPQLCW